MPSITAAGDSMSATAGVGIWPHYLTSRFGRESLTPSIYEPWTGAAINNKLVGNGYTMYAAGIATETTAQIRARWNTDVLGHESDYITLLAGINDIGDNRPTADIITDWTWMADSARANCTRFFACTILPWNNATTGQKDAIDTVNAAIRAYAAAHPSDTVLMDFFELMESPDGSRAMTLTADGLHPTGAGYLAMANAFDLAHFGYTAPPAPDVSVRVAAGLDDVLQRLTTAAFATGSTVHYLGNTNATTKRFRNSFRFLNIVSPVNPRVRSAKLVLTASSDKTADTCAMRVSGWGADNSGRISSTGAFDTAFAAKTTATTDVPSVGDWAGGFAYEFDVTAIVQEIVSRAGWSSGNALTIFTDDDDDRSSVGAVRWLYPFEGSAPNAALLEVTWASLGGSYYRTLNRFVGIGG